MISPCFLNQRHAQQQLDELQQSLSSFAPDDDDPQAMWERTRLEFQVEQARKAKSRADAELDAALAYLDGLRSAMSLSISSGLARDEIAYDRAIREMADKEEGSLEELTRIAEGLVNVGRLATGSEVEMVVNGCMRRAKVRSEDTVGRYELSLWTESHMVGVKYSAGFDTVRPKIVNAVPRHALYAKQRLEQTLSAAAGLLAKTRASAATAAGGHVRTTPREENGQPHPPHAPPPETTTTDTPPPKSSTEFLALLYNDAERTLPALMSLGAHMKKRVPGASAIVAPLKGEARATVKTRGGLPIARGSHTECACMHMPRAHALCTLATMSTLLA